jgi:SpoVK/Ycf46/Vps4 family AAA+-type ATPase
MSRSARLKTSPQWVEQDAAESQVKAWIYRAMLYRSRLGSLMEAMHYDKAEFLRGLGFEFEDADEVDVKSVRRVLERRLQELTRRGLNRDEDSFRNTEMLAATLGMSRAEAEILVFSVTLQMHEQLNECMGHLFRRECHTQSQLTRVLAHVLDLPSAEVLAALSRRGVLFKSRLLGYDPTNAASGQNPLEVPHTLAPALVGTIHNEAELLERFVQVGPAPELRLDDFSHMGQTLDLLRTYLTRSLDQHLCGVNVLLHGDPGTGKTQLARLLVREAGAQAFEVSQDDEYGNPTGRGERVQRYQLSQSLLMRHRRAVVLFDEAEDAFPEPSFFGTRDRGEKLWLNRLLEENPAPAIWTANRIHGLEEAQLRRFDLVVEMKRPARAAIRRVLKASLADLPHGERWLDRIAQDGRVAQADVTRAARVVRAVGAADADQTESMMGQVLDLNLAARFGKRAAEYPFDPAAYDVSLVNTDVPLPTLVETLKRRGRASVCLYGAPGTGKTAFVHYLAHQLDRPVLVKRASDLIDKYIGESEKNLAAMFHEARERGAVLLLDEADGFLRDRRGASHAWEVTQVNELLVQMEMFDGLFFCATNLLDDLDQASFRRFGLKVRFDPLKPAQRWSMFLRALASLGCGMLQGDDRALRADLDRLDGLTPGDFKAVRERFDVLGLPADERALLGALREELAVRRRESGRRVGFAGIPS